MDTLSKLLENVYLYDTKFYCLKGCGDWSYSLTRDGCDTLVFYIVIEGGLNIKIADNVRHTTAGDIIMISNINQHMSYSTSISNEITEANELCLNDDISQKIVTNKGGGEQNAQIVLIECRYDEEITRSLLASVPSILPDHKPLPENQDNLLALALKMLCIESSTDRIAKSAIINRMTSIIMIDCIRTHIEDLPESADDWLTALKDPYLAKALNVMHSYPENSWTIHKLAEVAGMSRSSFAERFKKIVGVPPLTYLIDYRLRLAARHLRLRKYSISRISRLVGYASDSTFSQAFKRMYGVSPRSYRQRYQVDNLLTTPTKSK